MALIFISYRRSDSGDYWAQKIAKTLGREFGGSNVFYDRTSIPLGIDYRVKIKDEICSAAIVLLLIGRDFFQTIAPSNKRRIDNHDDPVRQEIILALQHQKHIIPVIVDGASMPTADQFPKDIQTIDVLNGFTISKEEDLNTLAAHLHIILGNNNQVVYNTEIPTDTIEQELAMAKRRTDAIAFLIQSGWLVFQEQGKGVLKHPSHPRFRFYINEKALTLVLEIFLPDEKKWNPIGMFLFTDDRLGISDTLLSAAANPDTYLKKFGSAQPKSIFQIANKDLPLGVPSMGSMFNSAGTNIINDIRIQAKHNRMKSEKNTSISPLNELHLASGTPLALCFHPKKTLLASSGLIQVQIWDFDTNTSEILSDYQENVTDVDISINDRLAAGGSDGSIHIWEINPKAFLFTLRRPGLFQRLIKSTNLEIQSLEYSPDGKSLASMSHENTIWIWDVSLGKVRNTIRHQLDIASPNVLHFSPSGEVLAATGEGGQLSFYNPTSGTRIHSFTHRGITAFSFHPDQKKLAIGIENGQIQILDVETGIISNTLLGHDPTPEPYFNNCHILSLCFSPDGRWLTSLGSDQRLIFWNTINYKIEKHFSFPLPVQHIIYRLKISWSPNSKILAAPSDGNRVRIFKVADIQKH